MSTAVKNEDAAAKAAIEHTFSPDVWRKAGSFLRIELRRHDLSHREMLLAELILDKTYGWQRPGQIGEPGGLAAREVAASPSSSMIGQFDKKDDLAISSISASAEEDLVTGAVREAIRLAEDAHQLLYLAKTKIPHLKGILEEEREELKALLMERFHAVCGPLNAEVGYAGNGGKNKFQHLTPALVPAAPAIGGEGPSGNTTSNISNVTLNPNI